MKTESPRMANRSSSHGEEDAVQTRDQVDGRSRGTVRKQETEEEDIDELVRTFKESEAVLPGDGGGTG